MEYHTVGNSNGRISIRSEKMSTAKIDAITISTEPKETRTRSFSTISSEFIANTPRSSFRFQQRLSRSFFTCSSSKTAHRSDDSERLTKRNKSRSLCRGPFLISTPRDSAEAADPSVQLILICQRHSTILIQESHTQNRLNSESLRTDTLTKFSQQTVSGIRVTSFDSSSCLVNIAAR